MSQPQVRGAQLNSNDFRTIVSVGLGATLTISSLVEGQSLVYSGSPLGWRNATAAGGAGSVTAGDGLDSTAGSGSPFTGVFSVDATVARTNIATETFSFAGALSLNLTDTTQAADEDVWRISNSGGQFLISTRTDADGAGNNAIVIDRTGTTVDSITTGAPLISTASGVGTNSAIQLNSNIPALVFNDTDATASEGIWDITSTSASSALEFRTRTDAHGTGATWLQVVRSGTAVTSINFTGTAMTLNGISIHVGSPQPSGGGVGDALLAGSPITIINANSFALDQTLRIYDPGQTDYTDIYHDGSSLNFDSTNTAGVAFTFGGQSDFTIGSSSITLLRGNAFNMYNSTNNSLVQFAFDDSPTVHFRVVDFLGNVNYTVIEGMDLRIGTDDDAGGSPQGQYISFGLSGTDIETTFNKVNDWKITGVAGDMLLSHAGSPATYNRILTTLDSVGGGLGSPIGNPLELAPSKTSGASLRIPAGTAPSAPISGDLYATTQGLFFVGHGSPGNITHDLSHTVVSVVNSAVLTVNNTITVATIPGMSIHFVSPAANYICEIHIRGRQTVPEAGIRIQLDTSGFGGQIEWTMIEYNDNPTYGPITTTAGGSPITYPSGDTSSDDAQIRGVDFKEQGNVTTAQALFATYQNGTGEFILTGYGYLTTGGGSVSASVLGAQSNATVGNTSFGYTIAGKAWMKLTRVTH